MAHYAVDMEEGLLSPSRRSHLPSVKTVLGGLGLLVVGAMGVANKGLGVMGFANKAHAMKSSADGGHASFVPKQGVESVLVAPEGPNMLQVVAPPAGNGKEKVGLFIFAGHIPAELRNGATIVDGVLYGARQYAPALPGLGLQSEPTGHNEDVLTGKLLMWTDSISQDKLAIADELNKGRKRAQAHVVKEDGSTALAIWYHDMPLDAKESYFQKTEFKGVTALAKANLYFDNKVISHTIMFPGGKKKTMGVILPGEFYFGTEKAELMEITNGECEVKIDGTTETKTYGAGTKFRVEANSGFSIAVKGPAPAQYVCSYLDN